MRYKMRVLFFGFLFCDEFYHNVYVKSKFNVPLASHTYNKELIDGLSKCDDVSLSVYNVPPIGSFPINSEHIYMKEYKWDENYTQLGYLNLPVIKFKSQENILYNKVKNEVKKYYQRKDFYFNL